MSEKEKDLIEENCEDSSSEEEEYISTEDLVEKLENLIDHAKKNLRNKPGRRQDIYDAIEEHLPGNKEKILPPEIVSYLFTGWWVNHVSKESKCSDGTFQPDNCPICFRKFENNIPKEENDI